MLNELRDEIHTNAKNHGFYDDGNVNIPEKLMLIVSELGEAMEAYRNDNMICNCEFFNEFINTKNNTFNDGFETFITK